VCVMLDGDIVQVQVQVVVVMCECIVIQAVMVICECRSRPNRGSSIEISHI